MRTLLNQKTSSNLVAWFVKRRNNKAFRRYHGWAIRGSCGAELETLTRKRDNMAQKRGGYIGYIPPYGERYISTDVELLKFHVELN